MQIQMTQQVAKIVAETEKMTLNEKQSLFWIMVEKWGQENILNYNTTNTNQMLITVPKYLEIRKFGNENNSNNLFFDNEKQVEEGNFLDIPQRSLFVNALKNIQKYNTFEQIEDPILWQKQIRDDR